MKFIIIFSIVISLNVLLSAKVVAGNDVNKGIADELSNPKSNYDLSWIKELEKQIPQDTIITDITSKNEELLITYKFRSLLDVSNFCKLVEKLSKKEISVTDLKMPLESELGNAVFVVNMK